MSEKYNVDSRIIEDLIAKIKGGYFDVHLNDDNKGKNEQFRVDWRCGYEKIKAMLPFLEIGDYRYTVENLDSRLKVEELHIFKHTYGLSSPHNRAADVCVYVKLGIVEEKHLLVVSFHEDEPEL